jgi:hypothetical protein
MQKVLASVEVVAKHLTLQEYQIRAQLIFYPGGFVQR